MMYKLPALLLLSLSLASFSQMNEEELISWTEGRKLTWADYKGNAKSGTDAAASTATYLGIEYNFNSKGFGYKITCSFSKTRSWGLHKTEYILAHEQGHFDIAEIHARKLHKLLKSYKFNSRTVSRDVNKIYDTVMKEHHAFQSQYDQETNYSRDFTIQDEWLTKIESELKKLESYSNYQ